MPAFLVQRIRLAVDQLGPDLVAGDVSGDHRLAVGGDLLGFGQDRRNQHGAGMAVEPGVVVIERMRGRAINQREIGRGETGLAELREPRDRPREAHRLGDNARHRLGAGRPT